MKPIEPISRPTMGIREDLRYENKCPNCHSPMFLKVRVKTGTDDLIQWVRNCTGCHAEFVLFEEVRRA